MFHGYFVVSVSKISLVTVQRLAKHAMLPQSLLHLMQDDHSLYEQQTHTGVVLYHPCVEWT